MRPTLFASLLAGIFCCAQAAESTRRLPVPSADKKSGITLDLQEGWKTDPSKDGGTTIEVPRSGVHIQVWALADATVDDAVKEVPELIKGQVTGFKLTRTQPVTVAGSTGKQLTGTGEEADDGDPANAEVYLFAVEDKVYMICSHGEGDIATKGKTLLPALLASVKKAEGTAKHE